MNGKDKSEIIEKDSVYEESEEDKYDKAQI